MVVTPWPREDIVRHTIIGVTRQCYNQIQLSKTRLTGDIPMTGHGKDHR